MRRTFIVVIALLATACGATTAEVAEVAAPAEVLAPTGAEFVVASGLEAMAEAEGTPHILWFWGAY